MATDTLNRDNYVDVTAETLAARQGFAPFPAYPQSPASALRSPLPPILALQPDTLRQFYNPATSQTRVMPFPSSTNPSVGAQAQSQAITIVEQGQGTSLEVNNVKNADQTTLNLLAGSGIGLSADSQGGVTVSNTAPAALGDGLIHGDLIWETDSAYVYWRDDFQFGPTLGAGELGWNLQTQTGFIQSGGVPPNMGLIGWENSASVGQFNVIYLSRASGSVAQPSAWALLDYPRWKLTWVIGTDHGGTASAAFSLAKKSIYVGLYLNTLLVARPPLFLGLRYDTDPTIADTTFKLESVQNYSSFGSTSRNDTQGTVVDTGVTPTQGSFYRLEIECVSAGVVTMSLNGSAPVSFTIPTHTYTSAGTGQIDAQNGLANVSSGGVVGATPFAPGSKFTVAGLTGANAVLNGNWTAFGPEQAGSSQVFWTSGASIGPQNASFSVTGLPAWIPFFSAGNDSTASPVGDTVIFWADFFSFVWNPGVGGGTGTPVATKPRYW